MSLDNFLSIISSNIASESRYSFYILHNKVGGCVIKWNTDTLVYLTDLKINKAYRGNSLATSFYQMVEDELIDRDVERIELHAAEWTRKKGKLTNLYQSWGFEITGKGYQRTEGNESVYDIPMKKDIIP